MAKKVLKNLLWLVSLRKIISINDIYCCSYLLNKTLTENRKNHHTTP